jgi:hypothetical protein
MLSSRAGRADVSGAWLSLANFDLLAVVLVDHFAVANQTVVTDRP